MQKEKWDFPVESQGSEWNLVLLKLLMELRWPWAHLILRLGHGLCLMEWALWIPLVWIQLAVSHSLRTWCEKGSLPSARISVSGQEHQTLLKGSSPGLQSRCNLERAWIGLMPKLIIRRKSLCLEDQPWEVSQLQADPHHAVTLPGREKARWGCHIYGIKWLACSQIANNGESMRETPCTHKFLCSLINKSWKNHPLFIC